VGSRGRSRAACVSQRQPTSYDRRSASLDPTKPCPRAPPGSPTSPIHPATLAWILSISGWSGPSTRSSRGSAANSSRAAAGRPPIGTGPDGRRPSAVRVRAVRPALLLAPQLASWYGPASALSWWRAALALPTATAVRSDAISPAGTSNRRCWTLPCRGRWPWSAPDSSVGPRGCVGGVGQDELNVCQPAGGKGLLQCGDVGRFGASEV
jgi:hypothetical protein